MPTVTFAIDWAIKFTDILIFFATFCGPIAAVQIQKLLERKQASIARRAVIFRSLMSVRAAHVSLEFVQAFNAIPIEFYGKGQESRLILDKHKEYLSHLETRYAESEFAWWESRRQELLVSLLQAMAKFLGYEFNNVELFRGSYFPQHFDKLNHEEEKIRAGLAALLSSSKGVLPVEVRSTVQP